MTITKPPFKARHALAAAAALAVGALLAAPAAADTTWTGAADNNWFNPANWTNGVPSAANPATIGAPSPTNVAGATLINGLTVLSDGVLNVGNSSNFNFAAGSAISNAGTVNVGINTDFQLLGTVDNSGLFTMVGTSSASDFELAADANLVGGGTFTLGGINARFSDSSGDIFRLTNTDNTINGVGQIGANSIALTNLAGGLIDSDGGGTLTVDTIGNSFNSGLMRASNGTLIIANSSFDNTGGTISSAGGQVQLVNAQITGGLITGGDVFVPNSLNTDLADLTTDATIQVGINTDLGVNGTITNNGVIAINGSSSASDVELQTDTLFAGNGALFLDGTNARVSDSTGTVLVATNGANHTIRGNGQLGGNSIDIVNNGLVTADVAGGTMTLDPAGTFTNNATLRAENGGNLLLVGGSFVNAGAGLLEAASGSTVNIGNEARITGGNLVGDGTFVVGNSLNVGLIDLRVAADVNVGINTDLELTGTITNDATITVNGASSATDVELQGDVTLNGGGTLFLDGLNARVSDSSGAVNVLTNAAGHTIRGIGQLGANSIDVVNNGLVVADVASGTLTLDPTGTFTNNSTLRATGGGNLRLLAGAFANGDGEIIALSGSTVTIDSEARITGGVLDGSGTFVVPNSLNVGLIDLTTNGNVSVGINTDFELTGTIANNGSIVVNGNGSASDVELQGDVTLAGLGQIVLDGGNARISDSTGDALTLTNSILHVIRGNGQLGGNSINVVNNGSIFADVPGGTLTVDVVTNDGGLFNTGQLVAMNGGTLDVELGSSTFANDGLILAEANSLVTFSGNVASSASSSLAGDGTIRAEGGLITAAGIVTPGSTLDAIGDLRVEGELRLSDSTLLAIEILGLTPGSEHDQLGVTQPLLLDGVLQVTLPGSFMPDSDDDFVIATASSIADEFDNVADGGTLFTADGRGSFVVNYNDQNVVLTGFVAVPEPTGLALLLPAGGLLLRRRRA